VDSAERVLTEKAMVKLAGGDQRIEYGRITGIFCVQDTTEKSLEKIIYGSIEGLWKTLLFAK
jgi:hypothetical protein